MYYGYVYKTTNLVNDKIYIGQHKYDKNTIDNNYFGSGKLIALAIEKYGLENFSCEILEWCQSKKDLDSAERKYIKIYESTNIENGYNIALGGQGGNLGPDVISKIKKSLTGHRCSENTKTKLHLANLGKTMSDEVKEKISLANKGKIVSTETKYKMSISAKKLDHSNYRTNKGKIAITDGESLKFINSEDFIPEGFYKGNCFTSCKKDMSNYYSNLDMIKHRKEISSGCHNPMYGKGYKVSGGKNGHSTIEYIFNGNVFECRKYLLEYLKLNGFPQISSNVIRNIERNSYGIRTLNKYKYVIDNLQWRIKDENKIH